MPNYKDPRYSDDSNIEKNKEHRASAYRADEKWLAEEVDNLLDLRVVDGFSYVKIGKILGRHERSIDTELHAIAAGRAPGTDKGNGADNYEKPDTWLAKRAGLPFDKEDRRLTKLATGEPGRRHDKHHPEYIAAILRRETEEVRKWMTDLANPPGTFGLNKKNETDDEIAIAVHKCLE